MITVMLASSKASFLDKPSKKNIRYAHRFLAISLVMILITGIAAYQIRNYHLRKKKKPQLSVMQFLNDGELPDLRSILIGMSFGTVFGFLDVFFIFFGIDYLHVFMPEGYLTRAGLGDTYSDFMGSTVGAFISNILRQTFTVAKTMPIWVDTLGLLVGGVLGLGAAQLLSGKS